MRIKRCFLGASAIATFLTVCTLITSDASAARDYVIRKKVDQFTVTATIDRNPPILGHNLLTVAITDGSGKSLKDLVVMVNYYMPPMPGMAPMNYTIRANPKGDGYAMTMDLIMTGPWIIVIKFPFQGKRLQMSFPIDVR